ncbi:WD40-repeat-containing domain protein [Chlamydoabsidia padenii]|nr:WD40-repeat-containing domain protein [Chlamydoabsidia padenii]
MHSSQRKPKNNLVKTKSSFVLRMIIHDRLTQVLANRTMDDSFVFFNVGTSFLWMDAKGNPKDPLSRIVFTKAYPTCHDVNLVTRSSEHLDVIIGFSSGDCVWYDPLTSKYFRLNKDGNMKRGSVTNVKWIPGSEDLFLASFSDGTILILDKDREDQAYTTPSSGTEQQFPLDRFHATRPHKSAKYNPVSHWSVNEKGIVAFEFSPDGIHLAILGMDGTLLIMDYHQERVLDIFTSYYGNFLCVAWSPDGRYLLTGGQDDLVTIWGVTEKRLVARCQGHKSWVTKVAFDPYRCDDKGYRFGSVGEDCKLILWDFSYSALHRPKTSRTPTLAHIFDRHDDAEAIPPTTNQPPDHHTFGSKKRSTHHRLSTLPKKTSVFENTHLSMPTLHPAPNKTQVPLLQPSTIRTLHADPCVDVVFRQDGIYTVDRRGRIRTWGRP